MRFPRILGGCAIGISFSLFVFTLILWLRLYQNGDGITYNRDAYDANELLIRRCTFVQSRNGQILFGNVQISALMFGSLARWHDPGMHIVHSTSDIRDSPYKVWSFLSFVYLKVDYPSLRNRIIAIPHWAVVMLTALPSIHWLTNRLLRRRRSPTICSTCGYDLRATPTQCPECGNPALAAPLPPSPSSL